MKPSTLAVFIPCVLLAGCVFVAKPTNEPPAHVENTRTFAAAFDDVWSAAVGCVAEAQLPIQAIEKESGLLSTGFVTCDSGTIDAAGALPRSFLSIWSQGRYTLSFFLRDLKDGRTQVIITPHLEAYEMNVLKSWQPVKSKGVLEAEFLGKIANRLPSQPPTGTTGE